MPLTTSTGYVALTGTPTVDDIIDLTGTSYDGVKGGMTIVNTTGSDITITIYNDSVQYSNEIPVLANGHTFIEFVLKDDDILQIECSDSSAAFVTYYTDILEL